MSIERRPARWFARLVGVVVGWALFLIADIAFTDRAINYGTFGISWFLAGVAVTVVSLRRLPVRRWVKVVVFLIAALLPLITLWRWWYRLVYAPLPQLY